MKTINVQVYQYSELQGEAKTRARQWAEEFAADGFDDFDGLTGFTSDEIKAYGLNSETSTEMVNFEGKYFDLENRHLELLNPSWADEENARKFLGVSPELWNKVYCSFTVEHSGMGGRDTTIEFESQDEELTPEEEKTLDRAIDIFDGRRREWIRDLQSAYDSCFTEEYISELMEINEYTFLENGKRFG